MATPDLEVIKDIPGYKVILKAVLKSQIQQLVEQLAQTTEEESVILTASVSDGTLSHLGSDSGKNFLEDHEDIKSQFLGFCLKRHHKRKQEKEQEEALRSMQATPPHYGQHSPVGIMHVRSQRHSSPRQPVPVALTRAGFPPRRPAPYPRGRPIRHMPPNFSGAAQPVRPAVRLPLSGSGSDIIKIEPDDDDSNQSANDSNIKSVPGVETQTSSQSSSPSPSTSAAPSPSIPKLEATDRGDDSETSNQNEGVPDTMPAEGLSLDSDLSNLIPAESVSTDAVKNDNGEDNSELDQNVSVKVEALTESEMELEITGVEPGRQIMSPDMSNTWGQGSSGAYDMGATGSQGAEQGYIVTAPQGSEEEEFERVDDTIRAGGATKRATDWAFKKFNEWQKKKSICLDLHIVTPETLAAFLRQFYAEARTDDGKMYSPVSLRSLRAGVHRALISAPFNRQINIFEGEIFRTANATLDAMCKKWIETGTPKHHAVIEEGDLYKLGLYIQRFKENPKILLHACWFLLCYFFAKRGREGFRELKKDSFEIKTDDDTGTEYLIEKKLEEGINWQGDSAGNTWDNYNVRAYGLNLGHTTLSVVNIYRFFVSKLDPENDALFQAPVSRWEGKSLWFGKTVIGKNKLGELMKEISKAAMLSQIYTNHSVRATSISVMFHAGVDTKDICKISKHKNEESLKHYIIGRSSALKRRYSETLSRGLHSNVKIETRGESTSEWSE